MARYSQAACISGLDKQNTKKKMTTSEMLDRISSDLELYGAILCDITENISKPEKALVAIENVREGLIRSRTALTLVASHADRIAK